MISHMHRPSIQKETSHFKKMENDQCYWVPSMDCGMRTYSTTFSSAMTTIFSPVACSSKSTHLFSSSCTISFTTVEISVETLAWSATLFVVASAAISLTPSHQTNNAEGDDTSTTLTTFNKGTKCSITKRHCQQLLLF